MNVNINLRNVQEQVGENSEQVRKYAHKAALAYAGLWAMAYDSAKSGLDGSKEMLEKAEKRGEEVEQEFNKQYHKYYDQAMEEFKKLQERYGENLNLDEVSKYYDQAMEEAKKLQERYAGNLDLDEVSKTVTKTVGDNTKLVQENLAKALSMVGITGKGEDIRETVIEVTATVEETLKAPVKDYDDLTAKDLIAQFEGMSKRKLAMIREYEVATKNRVTVLRELDERLGEAVEA